LQARVSHPVGAVPTGEASTGLTVLLVEDDASLCDMYCLALRYHGFRVETAENAEQAIAAARSLRPSVILLDVGLPDRPGTAVLADLKADPETADLPVLMLSNFSEPEIVSTSLEAGAIAYLVKAETTPKRVIETISRLLAA
jgi:two-component system OmpR family response regulator